MPPPARTPASPPTQPGASASRIVEPTPEEQTDDEDDGKAGRQRKGTMSKNFKFPSPSSETPPPLPDIPPTVPKQEVATPASPRVPAHAASDTEEVALTPVVAHSVEVPPPPPVEKERSPIAADDEEVGDTEEISLN